MALQQGGDAKAGGISQGAEELERIVLHLGIDDVRIIYIFAS
jgi:hypothetical protein